MELATEEMRVEGGKTENTQWGVASAEEGGGCRRMTKQEA